MNLHTLRSLCCYSPIISLLLFCGCASMNNPPPKPTAPAEAAAVPPTHTVTRAGAKPKAQFDAVLEAVEMAPVKLETKAWADLTILQAVPHGAKVNHGDLLVKLDSDKLKEQIDELEQDKPLSVLAMELAVAELDNLQQTTQPKLQAARRIQRVADEDLTYFEKTSRALKEKNALFAIKNAEQRLEGAQEELKQLEKMYKADDLTEDTEEIILKRTKFAVESAVFSLDATKQSTDWTLKTAIPREAETLKAAKRDQDLALAFAEETFPRNLTKKRYDLEKLKRDQKKAEKRLADLKKDLESLDVRAPIDGVVYYGACEAGKWTTGPVVGKKLIPTGKLTPNEVFMTVVKPEKMVLRAVVQEGDLAQLKPGLEGKAAPVSAPDKKLPVKLEDLGSLPLPGGGFEAKLSLRDTAGLRLMPGMNCKVSLGDTKSDSLQVPKEAIFTEAGESFVFIAKTDAKPQKRIVKTGAPDGKMIEILEGLSEGDKILLQKP